MTDSPSAPPPVLFWFRVYCGVLCVVYVCTTLAGLPFLLMDPGTFEMSTLEARLLGGMLFVLGAVLLVMSAAPFFLAPRPWVWTYDLVIICLGMTSACFLPACIPLLIFWIKPEVKAHFGRV